MDRYDSVSAAFHALFPLEFDRVVPIFNCGAVESLLQDWSRTMTSLEDVSGQYDPPCRIGVAP